MAQFEAAEETHVPNGVPVVSDADEGKAAPVYSVIASPPVALDWSTLHETVAVVPEKVVVGVEGASGAREGTKSAGVGDATKPSPPAFVARTLNV